MFLKPSLSEVSIIYELPFSKSVWITYTLTVALLTVVLVFNRHVQKRTRPNKSQGRPLLWTDAVLDTIGIVCQQGAENVPESVSSRIVFVFLLLLSLFLITSYSAIIVSLLQMTSSSINTMADLMNSPMKLSMVDKFVNERTDPAVEKVFQEKLLTQPFQEAFVPEQVGLEKIRRGLYAFHGFFEAYKIISDTYEDHEKCRFKEINMFLSNHVGFPIRKGSPYSEHLRQRILWMREVGILGREEKRWYYQKPKCESGGQNFVSVGIQDFYPTLVILAYGILLSVGFLVVEAIHNRYKYKKKAQN
ncbi:glutamate [NMDA] receptor subunit 1-like [Periplaneta americana]|uniref:glutamate [NMDA] receptor subunit 1-like n=1 Tax=Periplaneta americana TaxID=6978 RepID=UPI0037E7CD39